MCLWSQRQLLTAILPPVRRKLSGKTANYLPAIIPLLKNERAARCVRKSALKRACLHTCVYELSWLCILSLREPGVITR